MSPDPASRHFKVLITDYAWNSLDLEESILKQANASLVVAHTGDEDELVKLSANVNGIMTCWKPVTEKVIANSTRCLAVGRYGVGLDNIDVSFSTKNGIVVTNVPSYCVSEVSDHTMALLLSLGRKVTFFDRAIKGGSYDLGRETPLYRIEGKILGLVGFGTIGKAVHRRAIGFGLRVIAYDHHLDEKSAKDYGVESVGFSDLLRRSDYVSIHVPLTLKTRRIFNLEAFRQMKPSAFLINTARGDIIDHQDLLEALNGNLIAGAGLDVLPKEPPDLTDPLLLYPRTIITPHAAFNSEESLIELREKAATQMADVILGRLPNHIVNREVLKQANLRARFTSPPV
jgi:D-3-phosphoglycerate dehydrogenase / 2-oxoglutarate reductase